MSARIVEPDISSTACASDVPSEMGRDDFTFPKVCPHPLPGLPAGNPEASGSRCGGISLATWTGVTLNGRPVGSRQAGDGPGQIGTCFRSVETLKKVAKGSILNSPSGARETSNGRCYNRWPEEEAVRNMYKLKATASPTVHAIFDTALSLYKEHGTISVYDGSRDTRRSQETT
ncbi:hypothetical protein HPB47_025459 [Ixodes persulcatus]|uniref:Uncharacterized protein n=1 Tax=Ixodes persulcatus TaxID=34615 RepID=A0AC60Q1W1_IXOPE|nr:hypothetical protein HPB47_025459 [Ixodes persulcatus]